MFRVLDAWNPVLWTFNQGYTTCMWQDEDWQATTAHQIGRRRVEDHSHDCTQLSRSLLWLAVSNSELKRRWCFTTGRGARVILLDIGSPWKIIPLILKYYIGQGTHSQHRISSSGKGRGGLQGSSQ